MPSREGAFTGAARLQPASLVALAAGLQVIAWTLAPALTHSAPPLDVVEGYMWGREWVIATYKHPALPSWVLEASRVLTGTVGWPAYLVSQLFVAATFALVFLLGRDLMGPERAAAGTLLLTGVAFYAWPTPEFNHNIAEMPFWAALPLALWRAVERRSALWWALAGAAAAAGLYAKLSTAVLIATAAGWIICDARARSCLATWRPWLGLALFVALVAPLGAWLIAHDFAPLTYAASRTAQRGVSELYQFAFNILANLAGLFVIAAAAGLIGPLRVDRAAGDHQPIEARAQAFLAIFTAGPLALTLAGAVLAQTGLKSAWGSSMFNLLGLLLVARAAQGLGREALARIAVAAALLLTIVPLAYAGLVGFGGRRLGTVLRVQWPQAEISERLSAAWARETGLPLRIVTGDNWTAGLVGLTARGRPSILNNGLPALSPWVTPQRIAGEGMLVAWQAEPSRLPPSLNSVVAAHPVRRERFSLPSATGKREILIDYAIVPPRPAAAR
jgi:4-amino-4-deoxy-L-arabinose transferase-like glycosyltransferase